MENQPESASILDDVVSCSDIVLLKDDILLRQLADYINRLILTNFEKMIQLLYRIDVSETRLKQLLKENPNEDAGKMIAALIIERQIQKINFKKEMTENEGDDGGEERL